MALESSSRSLSRSACSLRGNVVGSRNQVYVAPPAGQERDDDRAERAPKRRLAPDGSYSWVVLVASFIANLIGDGCLFSFGVLYVEFLDYFRESKAKTAWIGSLFMSVPLLTGPIASAFTNHFGCRVTTIVGAVIAAIGFVLSSVTDSVGQLCFTLGVVAGVGLSLVDVAANVIVAYYFEKRRAFATSTAAAGSGIGTFIFAVLAERLVELYTWKGAVLVMGGIMLNMVVCGALFIPVELPPDGASSSDSRSVSDNDDTEPCEKTSERTRGMLKAPVSCNKSKISKFIKEQIWDAAICHSIGFIYFAISCFLLYMWYDIPYIYLPDKASDMNISDRMASVLVSIIGIVSTVGQIVIGYLGDRNGVDAFYLYSSLTVVAGGVTMLIPVMTNCAGLAFLSGAYGFFISGNYALTTILLVELVGLDHLTSGYGLLLLVQGIANLLGPPIAGTYRSTYIRPTFFCHWNVAIVGVGQK